MPSGELAGLKTGREEVSIGIVLGHIPLDLLVTKYFWGAVVVLGGVPPTAKQVFGFRASAVAVVLALATWLVGARRLKHADIVFMIFIEILFAGMVWGFVFST